MYNEKSRPFDKDKIVTISRGRTSADPKSAASVTATPRKFARRPTGRVPQEAAEPFSTRRGVFLAAESPGQFLYRSEPLTDGGLRYVQLDGNLPLAAALADKIKQLAILRFKG